MLVVNTARSTKIDELDDGVLLVLKVDILGLDVTMNNIVLMEVVSSGEELADNVCCLNFIKMLISCYTLIQSTTMAHLIDEVDLFLIFIHLDNLADIWVIKLFQKLDLFEELATLSKLQIFFPDNLDCPGDS